MAASTGPEKTGVPEFWEIDPSEVKWTKTLLGAGGYGAVYEGWWRGNIKVALKRVLLKDVRTKKVSSAVHAPGEARSVAVAAEGDDNTFLATPDPSSYMDDLALRTQTLSISPKKDDRMALPFLSTMGGRSTIGGQSDGGYTRKDFDREAYVWYTMTSPFVLPLYGVGSDVNGQPYFVSPVMEKGNVKEYLMTLKPTPEDEKYHNLVAGLLYDIARGMVYLHDVANIVHTDLKAGNILVDSEGRVRVTDFGFAKPVDDVAKVTLPGTGTYLPPERLASFLGKKRSASVVTKAGDVYAFGILTWVLWTLDENPFTDFDELEKVLGGCRPSVPAGMPLDLACLMKRCWEQDPAHRPLFVDIVRELEKLWPTICSDRAPPSNTNVLSTIAASFPDGNTAFHQAQEFRDAGDLQQAIFWYKIAAELDHVEAQYELAEWCKVGVGLLYREPEIAARWYAKAAEKSHANSVCALGDFFAYGIGSCSSNVDLAKDCFARAAAQDHVVAQTRLASILDNEGCYHEALEYLKIAAKHQFSLAQARLADYYYFGRGMPHPDYFEAAKWYLKAAQQGNAAAQLNTAMCYENGRGVVKDEKEAVKWYKKAADQGHGVSQWSLGLCYWNGSGVELNKSEAIEFE
ncbi:kinase-like protein [Gonapodya prolifera JEL478]|uniref:Kinase-like protein n=1 Tax=Gonapodya prolifera (strain JEL478) TaxID=1344416 RepID=A0A139ACN4_GONPJ|nr:kinase-like protein [Gonapodya prolifera JEL478]|eukprot:KXS14205.1 kinase-like protein [Gonapodya prolifera JEL478]